MGGPVNLTDLPAPSEVAGIEIYSSSVVGADAVQRQYQPDLRRRS